MALRKASTYSKKKARPFTRISRKKSKAYIKTVPSNKLAKYHQGSPADFSAGNHDFMITLVAEERAQVRDNALESCRMYLTKILDEGALGKYYMEIKAFPHHMLRENKLSAGAGADRLSTGMTHSYGIIIGRAALVSPGKVIIAISCADEKTAKLARDTLIKIKAKLPCSARVKFEKIVK